MSKIEDIKTQYLKDADMISSKQRFGFFSIPPNANTCNTEFEQKKIQKDENGKVKTQQRNIFSGPTASGILKKSFFQYSKSVFQNDPYMDPGKNDRKLQLQKSKLETNPDVYKPLSLTKTPDPKASYEYIPQNPKKKLKNDFMNQQGKIKTEERNIVTNLPSKIEKQRKQQYKYIPDPYEGYKKTQRQQQNKSISKRGQAPFRSSSPVKPYFSKNTQIFGNQSMNTSVTDRNKPRAKFQKQEDKSHDGAFKPSCTKKFDTFSYPEYMPSGTTKIVKKVTPMTERAESFKLTKLPNNFKPCPSISTMKTNILKKVR